MGQLRTPETQALYEANLAARVPSDPCPLCEGKSLKEFKHWRIMQNAFPYDKIAEVHHMIIPKRHAADRELTVEEKAEFDVIKEEYLHKMYEFFIEASSFKKSVPAHAHLHLIVAKD